MKIAMIPARMGSQRLAKKNLRELNGVPLISRAIRKCLKADVFDQIWVNSEHLDFAEIAEADGVKFHHRPESLGNNQATSEDYITEFLQSHECDYLVQVHSIAPLLTVDEIRNFVHRMDIGESDCLLGTETIQIECAYGGKPVNFTFDEKTNSQDLEPVHRISWSMAGWKRACFLQAKQAGQCATYAGRVDFFALSRFAAHVIKTEEDLAMAEALLPFVQGEA